MLLNQIIFKRVSLLYLIGLLLLMVIPIGNGSGVSAKVNNIFIVGYRGDYILHCLIYLPWVFVGKFLCNNKISSLLWFIAGAISAVGLEYIQMLLPYRGFNINDLIAGVIGVLVSFFMALLISQLQKYNIKIKQ